MEDGLSCNYAGWVRRTWILRCHVVAIAFLDAAMAWVVIGPELGYKVTSSSASGVGLLLCLAWVPLFLLMRDPREGPACLLDPKRFQCGWVLGSSEVELLSTGGDLLVAGAERDTATRWLDAHGLSHLLVMRLDDDMTFWIAQAAFGGVGAVGAIVILISVCLGWTLWSAVLAFAVMLALQVILLRWSARATIVLDDNGVRVRRFARRTRLIPWLGLRFVDDGDGAEAAMFEKVLVLVAGDTTLRLPHRLSGSRLTVLLARLRSMSRPT